MLAGCGEVYRPIATPVTEPGADPQTLHYAIALSSSGGTAGEGRIAQINVPGDVNVGNRDVGIDPVSLAMAPLQSRVFVVNRGEDNISSYVPTSLGIPTATIGLEPGAGATFVAASLGYAWVTESSLNKVALIDSNQGIVLGFIPVGANPVAIATDANASKAYVVNNGDNTVSVVSAVNRALLTTIAVGSDPVAIVMSTNGAYAYVANRAGNSISVIDTSTDTEIQRIGGVSSPTQLVWDDHLKRLYVVSNDGIVIYNAAAAQLALLKTVNPGYVPLGVAVLDDGSRFYTLHGGSPGTVDVYDAQSYTKRTTVTVQNAPTSIVASPGSQKVLVTNSAGTASGNSDDPLANGSISIIKTLNESVLNIPAAGPNPFLIIAQ